MPKPACTLKSNANQLQNTVDFLKVISDANRLRIICLLNQHEHCVCELMALLDLPQNLASHHLSVLRKGGIVSSRKLGLKTYYTIQPEVLQRHLNIINKNWGK